jgi:hypothetical protein
MAINLVVAIEPTFEAVERGCGVGSLPIDVIEALAFQGMIVWTWSRVLLIKLARELKKKSFLLEKIGDTFLKPPCSPRSKISASELQ